MLPYTYTIQFTNNQILFIGPMPAGWWRFFSVRQIHIHSEREVNFSLFSLVDGPAMPFYATTQARMCIKNLKYEDTGCLSTNYFAIIINKAKRNGKKQRFFILAMPFASMVQQQRFRISQYLI